MAQKRAPRGGRPQPRRAAPAKKKTSSPPRPAPLPPFRLGAMPGAMPGKWIERWRVQRPHQPIDLVPVEVTDQEATLRSGDVDAVIARAPIAGDDLHVVDLYEEIPVVVMSTDSDLCAADELTPDDLAGEVLIVPGDDVIGALDLPTTAPAFPSIPTTEDVIATVASGVGIAIVPMSLARLYRRKDVEQRPLAGATTLPVVLAWLRERDAEDVQAFVAITRGRTARSSR